MPSLTAINALDQAAFAETLGPLFEQSPWVVAGAWPRRPFADAEALLQACASVLDAAGPEAQLALIRAHPDLAGKAALARTLTPDSTREQASAGLDRLDAEEYARFHRLNAAYFERFGFPFVICVRRHDKDSILAAFERRLGHDAESERRQALAEILDIVRLRLADLLLEGLAAAVRRDLDCLAYPSKPWVRPRSTPDGGKAYDVVVVGGGQSGLAAAFGLMRERIDNILVIDENPAGLEGPWVTYARMVTLRTPKYLTGPDLGLPSLTFRTWWETQFGAEAWEALGKIPRGEWMRYLRWYRRTLGIPVRNETRLDRIEPIGGGLFRLAVSGAGAPDEGVLFTRKLVLATGIQGGGEWHVPGFIAETLPRHRYAHTSEAIDYAALKGQRIGILGGGASAFDNAQYALKAGVGEAHVFVRRPALPRVNPIRFMENAGFLGQFAGLDDARKYAGMSYFLDCNQPPTNDTFERAAAYPGFRLHLGAPWREVADTAGGVQVTTPQGTLTFDLLVLSTGLLTDTRLRPELALLSDDIALWRDRYRPPTGKENALLDRHPYLGPDFAFTPRTPEAAPRLHGLFAFNYSALASLGLSASALSGMKFAVPRLVQGIARHLFVDDADAILKDYQAYDEEEFVGRWPAR